MCVQYINKEKCIVVAIVEILGPVEVEVYDEL